MIRDCLTANRASPPRELNVERAVAVAKLKIERLFAARGWDKDLDDTAKITGYRYNTYNTDLPHYYIRPLEEQTYELNPAPP